MPWQILHLKIFLLKTNIFQPGMLVLGQEIAEVPVLLPHFGISSAIFCDELLSTEWLEDDPVLLGQMAYFQGRTVSFREGRPVNRQS